MSIQSIEALNYFNLFNYAQDVNNILPSTLDFKEILGSAAAQQTGEVERFVNAEQSLKELYPGLKYQVLDASQFTYFNRLDFPTSKLYGDNIGEKTINDLKSWKPKTQYATGYEPWVQSELEKVPNGQHVVLIHPDVQKKMEQDPDYAKQIVAKIKKYFDDDIQVNASIDPGSVISMSQLVSITKDGEIGFHETVCDGPSSKTAYTESVNNKVHATNKEKNLLNGLLNTASITSLPMLEGKQIISFVNNYNYAYQIYGLSQKRKTENGEII